LDRDKYSYAQNKKSYRPISTLRASSKLFSWHSFRSVSVMCYELNDKSDERDDDPGHAPIICMICRRQIGIIAAGLQHDGVFIPPNKPLHARACPLCRPAETINPNGIFEIRIVEVEFQRGCLNNWIETTGFWRKYDEMQSSHHWCWDHGINARAVFTFV